MRGDKKDYQNLIGDKKRPPRLYVEVAMFFLCDRRKELSLVYRIDIHDIEDNDDSHDAHDEEQHVSNNLSALLGI